MAISPDFITYIEDQLSTFGEFESMKMFGGIGYYRENVMFGMISNDVFRLKVDERNQADYESRGMMPYNNDKKKKGMPFWEVPPEVIEDKEEFKKWADIAFSIALEVKK